MDFMPDSEFNVIFNRVSAKVDLRGVNNPEEVSKRLNQKIKEYPPRLSSGWIHFLERLMFSGFSRRVIDQSISQPYGLVSLTLKHGRERAKHILLHRARRQLGSLRFRKRRRRR